MITVADLRARNALPSWQESVAIVQELVHATVAARGSAARLPDVEHIGLGADGTIALLAGGASPQDPVRHLAVLLDLLLEDVTAPDQLLQLVKRNIDDPPEAESVDELAKSLAFFERPGRRDDIARLVARAAVAEEQTRADEELQRLKMRALEAEKPRQEDRAEAAAPPHRSVLVPVAVVAALVLGAVGGVLWWTAQATGSQFTAAVKSGKTADGTNKDTTAGTLGKAPDQPASLLERFGTAVLNAASSLTGSSTEVQAALPPPVPPAPTEAAHVRRRRSSRTSSHAALTDPVPAIDDETDPVMIITTELGGRPLEPASAAPEPEANALYTSGDLDVLPPTIVRPVIPPPPAANAPPESKALFDVVVDRQGRVEQVQLASSPSRFHERMILSHIKAWTFQPAVRDGRPVRYRLRVLLSV